MVLCVWGLFMSSEASLICAMHPCNCQNTSIAMVGPSCITPPCLPCQGGDTMLAQTPNRPGRITWFAQHGVVCLGLVHAIRSFSDLSHAPMQCLKHLHNSGWPSLASHNPVCHVKEATPCWPGPQTGSVESYGFHNKVWCVWS